MRTLLIASCMTIHFLAPPSANAGLAYQWSYSFTGATDANSEFISARGYGVAVDSNADVIITGVIDGVGGTAFGDTTAIWGTKTFVVKFSSGGVPQWVHRFGPVDSEVARGAVATDAAGNVFVTGYSESSVDFGGGPRSPGIFLVKYDSQGTHQWSRTFPAAGGGIYDPDEGRCVAVDEFGDVFIAGNVHGTVDFGGGALACGCVNAIFAAKFDASGAHQWSRQWGGVSTSYISMEGIAVDAHANVTIAGSYAGSVDLGGGPLVAGVNEDIFLAVYDEAGIHQWSKRVGGDGIDDARDIAVDPWGNIFIVGWFTGDVDFGGGVLSGEGGDSFVVKYTGVGQHLWSRHGSGSSWNGAAIDLAGNVFLIGYMFPSAVVAKYDNDGIPEWSQQFTGLVSGKGIATGGSEGISIVGSFRGTVDLGGGAATSIGYSDGFVAKYAADNPVPVLISLFSAIPLERGVGLDWQIAADDAVEGFVIYRRDDPSSREVAIQSLASTERLWLDSSAEPGHTYHYQLLVRSPDGDVVRSHVVTAIVPSAVTALGQNHPNPFNPSTTIRFVLPAREHVTLLIYDANGRVVRTLVNEVRAYGQHEVTWDGRDDAGAAAGSGVYFYRLTAGKFTESKKMVLLK